MRPNNAQHNMQKAQEDETKSRVAVPQGGQSNNMA
jgi:hypothetical protein